MEPIEAERHAAAPSKEEKRHAEDMAVCGEVGEEFGLGTVVSVSRSMDDPSGLSVLGCLFILGSLIIGLPVGIGVGFSSVSPTAKLIVAATFGGMFVLGWPAAAISTRYQVVGNRIALYSGGVAQIRRKEPEPRVLHWADIETVTIRLTTNEGTPETGLASCTLRARDGTEITDGKAAEAVALAAHRALGPRLVPPLIEAYDSGEPVTAGDARIDHEGFTLRPGKRLTWPEIKSVTIQHASRDSADVASRIDIRVIRKSRLHYFDPTRVPNAIFFAHVLARAATRNGIRVDGYEQSGQGHSQEA
jgi:hypothetical protein